MLARSRSIGFRRLTYIFISIWILNSTYAYSQLETRGQNSAEDLVRLLVATAQSSDINLSNSRPKLAAIQADLVRMPDRASELVAPLLDSPDPRVSEAAADILQRWANPLHERKIIEYSLRILVNRNSFTKDNTGPGYYRLVAVGPAAFPLIYESFKKIEKVPVRGRDIEYSVKLVEVSAELPGKRGEPVIRLGLASDAGSVVSASATAYVKSIGGYDYKPLTRVLSGKWSHRIIQTGRFDYRIGVVYAIKMLNNPEALPELIRFLKEVDAESSVQEEPSVPFIENRLRMIVVSAIDKLSGENLQGDYKLIENWIKENRRPAK